MKQNKLRLLNFAAVCALSAVVGACDEPTNTNVAASELLEIEADNVI